MSSKECHVIKSYGIQGRKVGLGLVVDVEGEESMKECVQD